MPDPNSPAAKPGSTAPDEFDFDLPVTENPRIKRRSLKAKPAEPLKPISEAPATHDLEREAPPLPAEAARPEHQPQPRDDADAEINAAVKITEPAPASKPAPARSATTAYTPRTSPSPSTEPAASPHGTRPATLYYSSNPRKDKEEPAPMKPTPPVSSASSSSPSRPAAAPASRPASISDFRTNVDRQAREQKSVGNVLALIVYVFIGFFVVSALFAGYGIYALSKQVRQQSLTIEELDKHYASQHQELSTQLNATIDNLTKAQAQIGREQELIIKQQDTINKLLNANDATTAALRQEKQARAAETASLRARVSNLEGRSPR